MRKRELLGENYWKGGRIGADFATSEASHLPGATVWQLSPDLELGISAGGRTAMIEARQVVMATGALERPSPIRGWTLPGVMTAGAAQILLKTSGVAVSGKVVLAGCGPLLWLIAAQYLTAGQRFDAILDTTPRGNWAAAFAELPRLLASPYLATGLKLMGPGPAGDKGGHQCHRARRRGRPASRSSRSTRTTAASCSTPIATRWRKAA
ncbi:FAD/NAD(P)-binding oxidoreductase [Aureimonas sp. ME7]|uniref:NAD(P)/FAD-dependent oxidoreductase n=1 Tax=Aureimonas sp. ME7 TaxID=2744252 RepID=UPI0015F6C7BE|nr:FAD/NAD(P)-binding oxidoreductase [Aureimonas sp. ME7]